MSSDRVCLGAFAGAHGVRGEALIKAFTDDAASIADYGPVETEDQDRSFTLKFIRETKPGFALVRSPDIKTREDAIALKGVRLYVARDALPAPEADEFYLIDLVGLAARFSDGRPAGGIKAVHDFGAGDLLEITNVPDVKGPRLIPFTREAVPDVNLKEGYIVVSEDAVYDVDNDAGGEHEEGGSAKQPAEGSSS